MLSKVLADRWIDDPAKSAEALPDGELVIGTRTDPQAFAALYLRYVGAIHAYCYWRLGSRETAEDATSQVFAQALAGLPRFDGNRGTFRSWLFVIANHVVIDHYRKTRPSAAIDSVLNIPDNSSSPEELAVASEQREALRKALQQLSPRERQVVELRLAGLTGREIGEVLGCSTSAIGAAQYRAVSHLRMLLGKENAPEGMLDV